MTASPAPVLDTWAPPVKHLSIDHLTDELAAYALIWATANNHEVRGPGAIKTPRTANLRLAPVAVQAAALTLLTESAIDAIHFLTQPLVSIIDTAIRTAPDTPQTHFLGAATLMLARRCPPSAIGSGLTFADRTWDERLRATDALVYVDQTLVAAPPPQPIEVWAAAGALLHRMVRATCQDDPFQMLDYLRTRLNGTGATVELVSTI